MKLSKSIEQIVVPEFLKLGFSCEKERNYWIFTRIKDFNQQMIQIDKSDWERNTVRATYSVAGMSVNTFYFLNQPLEDWHVYTDEESLTDTLHLIVQITKEHALDWFERNHRAPKQLNGFEIILDDTFRSKAEAFCKQNQLETKKPRSLEQLEEILRKDSSHEMILYATFFLGEVFKHNLGGGKWVLSDENEPKLIDIGDLEGYEISPYAFVMNVVEDSEDNLYEYYEVWNELMENAKMEG